MKMVGIAPAASCIHKELTDEKRWNTFKAGNRNAVRPVVLRRHHAVETLSRPGLSNELVKLIEAVAEKYKEFFADWGYHVGDRLRWLYHDVRQNGGYELMRRYLQELLSTGNTDLPSPENIVSSFFSNVNNFVPQRLTATT